MSAWTYCLQDGKAAPKIVPPRLRIPCWKGLGADSEEKHEPASDIDTMAVDSLKALDPKRPIREADITRRGRHVRFVPISDIAVHSNTSSARRHRAGEPLRLRSPQRSRHTHRGSRDHISGDLQTCDA